MPRGPRIDALGILQHVMARGIERREIFRDDEMLGPEFTPAGGECKGITLADEEAFRQNLKLPKPPALEK
jgi:hypothetical protein